MKCFIIVGKIPHAGIVPWAARIPGSDVGLRPDTTRDFVASIPQSQAPHSVTHLEGFHRHGRNCPYPSHDKNKIGNWNSNIRSSVVEEALNQKPKIELPDRDGLLAELILRLVRGSHRSGRCGIETRPSVCRRSIVRPTGTRRRLPEPAETDGPPLVAEPVQLLAFVELAQRQAHVFTAKEGVL